MHSSWTVKKIGDLGRIVTGKTPPTTEPENFGGDIPFVTPKDMDGRRIISKTERYLTKKGLEKVKTSYIPAGSVMVSCIGSQMGKVAIAGKNCVTNQQINSIMVNDENDALFVYYNLLNRQNELRYLTSGSAQPILNKNDFSQLEILLPPLPEQKAIAHILGTLDDKIELNRRMNETLEELAKAIFKSWFVDFDPVIDNALKAGNPIPDALAEKAARRRAILENARQNFPLPPDNAFSSAPFLPREETTFPSSPLPSGETTLSSSPPPSGESTLSSSPLPRGETTLSGSPLPLGEAPPSLSPLPLGEGLGVREKEKLKDLISFARKLRRNQTDSEALMWRLLRNRQFLGLKFRRQHPIPPFILDFYCPELKLAIEIDGGQHNDPGRRLKDAKRTQFLRRKGIEVIRFWVHDVLRDPESVLEALYHKVMELSPHPLSPSPSGRGGNIYRLSPEIARLFPDSFEDSPLGPIPKGWRVGSIKDIAILQRKNIKPFEYPEKIFLHYSIPSFDEGKVPKREKGKDIKSNKYLVPHEAVLISKLNPRIPRVWLPCPEEDIHAICSTEFFVLAPSKVSKEYLYCLLNSENFLNVFATLATGTSSSHQRVKPESLLQIELIIPQGDCVKLFTDQVFYIFQKIKQNEKEIQTLGSLRDPILPKLISGQIRIKDAEKFVEGMS